MSLGRSICIAIDSGVTASPRIRSWRCAEGWPERTARDGCSSCPEGERFHEEEADTVEGDPADARREGTVPDRRWRAKWRQRPAAKELPEHQEPFLRVRPERLESNKG